MENSYVLHLSDHNFNDLYLCLCGYSKCEPLHSFGPAVRPNYILHYILEGKGRYHAGDVQYALQAGQGFLIEPHVQTFYQADEKEPWTYLWIGFHGDKAGEYLRSIGLSSGHLTYRSSHSSELKQIVFNMLKNNTSSPTDQFFMQSLLYSFFAVLARDISAFPTSRTDGDNLYIRRALEYIHNNYSNTIHVADIAAYVCIDRSYLYTLFRRNLGVSPQDYLTNCRITCAAELLTVSELPISGVALSCGYQDPLVFSKAFKQKKGITPSQYRRKYRDDAKDQRMHWKEDLEEL